MGELVDGDALIVVPVQRQGQDVLLAEAGGLAAGSSHALVLERRIGMIAVLRHIGVDLVLADHDQIHARLDHRPDDVGPTRQHVPDDLSRAVESQVGHLARGHDGHAIDFEVLLVERAGRIAVSLAHHVEE